MMESVPNIAMSPNREELRDVMKILRQSSKDSSKSPREARLWADESRAPTLEAIELTLDDIAKSSPDKETNTLQDRVSDMLKSMETVRAEFLRSSRQLHSHEVSKVYQLLINQVGQQSLDLDEQLKRIQCTELEIGKQRGLTHAVEDGISLLCSHVYSQDRELERAKRERQEVILQLSTMREEMRSLRREQDLSRTLLRNVQLDNDMLRKQIQDIEWQKI